MFSVYGQREQAEEEGGGQALQGTGLQHQLSLSNMQTALGRWGV
jgi:hypothetical protein